MKGSTVVRSRNVDRFNHDEDAAGYDVDVTNESDPIRAGYSALLRWIVERSTIGPDAKVLELGSGTGNLTRLLPICAEVVCVDISLEMTNIARTKLASEALARRVDFVAEDVLAFLTSTPDARFTHIISSYTLHHLEDPEKELFFRAARRVLAPNGKLVIGDLMFQSPQEQASLLESYRSNQASSLADDIEDEYFWNLCTAVPTLGHTGFTNVHVERFSTLSWGLSAEA